MRTSPPAVLPIFRSEMQMRMLALLLLQPERRWTLDELVRALDAPGSSVHRELRRAEGAGVIRRDSTARPHRFAAASEDSFYAPLAELLRRSVGVEQQLRRALDRPDVLAAVIHGSWASGSRRPDSDVDVLVVGEADLRELRREVRPIGRSVGRAIDLVVLGVDELRRMSAARSGFIRGIQDGETIPLVGDLSSIVRR